MTGRDDVPTATNATAMNTVAIAISNIIISWL